MFLILDRLKAHRARLTRDWLAEHRSEIEVHYLPPYSPELNPDEGVNADLKQAVPRKAPARSKQLLKRAAVSHMRSLSSGARLTDGTGRPRPRCPARRYASGTHPSGVDH